MKINDIDVPEISISEALELLHDEMNTFFYGNMGIGKSSIVRQYAEETGKDLLIFPLATMLPEFIGGVPYAKVSSEEKTEYFTLILNDMLEPIFKVKGKNWILFFDEMNQAPTEVMNACYSICHNDPKQREWCGHSLEFAQIIGAGNLADGSDKTVYLNELPGPLHDRFDVFQIIPNKKDTMAYLKKKWKNIPQVAKYIKEMIDSGINPRNIDHCLSILQYEKNPLRLRAKLGTALTAKILDIQKDIRSVDPTTLLKGAKEIYRVFKEDGEVTFGIETITTEKALIEKFRESLSEEEIQSVLKEVE